jgi:hypothetical protein
MDNHVLRDRAKWMVHGMRSWLVLAQSRRGCGD